MASALFAAGLLYQASTWTAACLVLVLAHLGGAVIQPWTLTKIASTGHPTS